MKKRFKLYFFEILSFTVSVLPLICVIVVNREKYFTHYTDGVRLSLGCLIILICMLLNAFGRFKIPRGISAYLSVFILSYLLSSILSDLTIISGAALLGSVLDSIFLRRYINQLRERLSAEKNASITAEKVEAVLERYLGGRV